MRYSIEQRVSAVLLLFALCAAGAAGEEGIVKFFDYELVKVDFQAFGGLTLVAQGRSSPTSFGLSPDFADILGSYPDSRAALRAYQVKNSVGNALVWGGLAAVMAGSYYPVLSGSYYYGEDWFEDYRTQIIIMLGGLAAEIVGSFLLPSSFQDLLRSVNLYNRRKIGEYR